jgi:hypothetical protein
MSFLYGSRYLKTRAKALVTCIFQVLVKKYPEYFKDIVQKECRGYMRENVTRAYKFQRMIDTQPISGLNYGSIEGIRQGVEDLRNYEKGIIPSRSTIARCARQLEFHAASQYGLEIIETNTGPGPVFAFEMCSFRRTILKGFGLTKHAETGSQSTPVMICWTLDYAQLTRELGHFTGGVKIVDPRAVDPTTGYPCLFRVNFNLGNCHFHVGLHLLRIQRIHTNNALDPSLKCSMHLHLIYQQLKPSLICLISA